jgi:uncharacterized protein
MSPNFSSEREAEFVLADALLESTNTREAARGFRLLRRIAAGGDLSAHLGVGYCYDVGLGVRRSRADALRWYRRAAAHGVGAAAGNIGCIYRDEGRPRLALRWFRKAVAAGATDSLLDIARLNVDTLKDLRSAREALRRLVREQDITEETREQGEELLRTLTRVPTSHKRGVLRRRT